MSQFDIPKTEIRDETLDFFKSKGYDDIRKADISNINQIFYATKDGEDVFIKKYTSSKEGNVKRSSNELACYENMPKDLLIDSIEINTEDQYLVLKKVDLQDIERTKESIDEILSLLEKLEKIDASFLSIVLWKEYENLFGRMQNLEANGIINDSNEIVKLFEDSKNLIENAAKVFSHHDFNLRNIGKQDGRTVIFDFEYAGQDNAMVDWATFYIDIFDDEKMKVAVEEKIKSNENYDEKLFDLMVMRRCAIVLYRYQNRDTSSDFFQKNLSIFKKIQDKYK